MALITITTFILTYLVIISIQTTWIIIFCLYCILFFVYNKYININFKHENPYLYIVLHIIYRSLLLILSLKLIISAWVFIADKGKGKATKADYDDWEMEENEGPSGGPNGGPNGDDEYAAAAAAASEKAAEKAQK